MCNPTKKRSNSSDLEAAPTPVCGNGSPKAEVKDASLGAYWVKWGVLAILVFQNSAASLLMSAASRAHSAERWNTQTGVILQEAIKAVMCVGLLLHSGGSAEVWEALAPTAEAVKTSIPALLYLFQNNMQYVAVSYLDAATYAILYQLKILTAAMMSVVILRKSLSGMQWIALMVLTVGASVVVVSQMTTNSSSTSSRQGSIVPGVVAVLLACLASGLAGVYFEKLLKGSTVSLWARNLQLALYSLVVGFGGLYQSSGIELLGPDFFKGYTTVVLAAVVNNALGGLLIAVVIKHADTIMKNFSTTLSIIVTTLASVLLFGSRVNCTSALGTALVIYAVFLYGGMTGLLTAQQMLRQVLTSKSKHRVLPF